MAENKNEFDELDEIYRQKLENQKKAKKEKPVKEKPQKAEAQDKKEENVKIPLSDSEDEPKPKKRRSSKKKKPEESEKVKKQKKIGSVINITACSVFFVGAICFQLFMERPTISESEKRELAKFPTFTWESYWSGEFTEGISTYFNDTVPFRDELKSIGAVFRSWFGFTVDGNVIVGNVSNVNSGEGSKPAVTTTSTKPIIIVTPPPSDSTSDTPSKEESSAPATTPGETSGQTEAPLPTDPDGHILSYPTPSDPDAQIIFRQGNQVAYISRDELYAGQLYGGDRDNFATNYISSVNTIKELLPDVNVYNMTCLTQNTFFTPVELNTETFYTEQSDAAYISNNLRSDIINIDLLTALTPHLDENIFFLRDCHWQQKGAYYAAEAFANAAGVDFAPLSSYTPVEKICLGSVYLNTQYDGLMYEGEDFTYYIPPNETKTDYYDYNYELQYENYYLLAPDNYYGPSFFYNTFMMSDEYIKHISTDVENGRSLVILKDDYANPLVPCLTSSFEDIYVIDIRYCNFNPVVFAKERQVTDFLICVTTENAMDETGTYISDIISY